MCGESPCERETGNPNKGSVWIWLPDCLDNKIVLCDWITFRLVTDQVLKLNPSTTPHPTLMPVSALLSHSFHKWYTVNKFELFLNFIKTHKLWLALAVWVRVVVTWFEPPPIRLVSSGVGVTLEGGSGLIGWGAQVELLEAEAEAAVVVWPRSPLLPSGCKEEIHESAISNQGY